MKIERIINDEGICRCLEVGNTIVSRKGMAQMVSSFSAVTITKSPRFFDGDVFCEFTYNGKCFEILEPYGDSTTYDIVASSEGVADLAEIAGLFERATPIKGGDWGYNSMYLLRTVLVGLIFIGIVWWFSS